MLNNKLLGTLAVVAMLVMVAITRAVSPIPERPAAQRVAADQVMLILRGIANSENPRGQLDDPSALEYAQRLGFRGEVLDDGRA